MQEEEKPKKEIVKKTWKECKIRPKQNVEIKVK